MLEKKYKDILDKIPTKLLLYLIPIGIMIIVIVFSDGNSIIKKDPKVDKEKIISLFDKINNNYQMDVIVNNDGEETKYTYNTDGKIELYETGANSEFGYFKYKNKIYEMSEDIKILEYESIPNYIDNPYQNISFIKNLINKCEFEYVIDTNTICNLKETEYINEYNSFFNKNYDNFSTNDMKINIYYGNNISKIEIDYSNINKKINNENNNLSYSISLSNIDKNDFSEIIEYIDTLVKE